MPKIVNFGDFFAKLNLAAKQCYQIGPLLIGQKMVKNAKVENKSRKNSKKSRKKIEKKCSKLIQRIKKKVKNPANFLLKCDPYVEI